MNWYCSFSLLLLLVCSGGASIVQADEDDQLEERIRKLLIVEDDLTGRYRRELLGYGDRALPVLRKILSSPPGNAIDEYRVSRALTILADIGGNASKLRPEVQRKFLSESASIRWRAVEALASIGSSKDVPILVGMLYDYDSTVRYQAARALGKLGDGSVLPALEIWQKQAAETDKLRPLEDKWLTDSMLKILEEAETAIKHRNNSTTEANDPRGDGK